MSRLTKEFWDRLAKTDLAYARNPVLRKSPIAERYFDPLAKNFATGGAGAGRSDVLHPIFDETPGTPHMIFTFDDPHADPSPELLQVNPDEVLRSLEDMGASIEVAEGHYGGPPEKSFIVSGIDPEAILRLGNAAGQESVIVRDGPENYMVFVNGKNAGKALTGKGYTLSRERPDGPHTLINTPRGPVYFLLNFDWDGPMIDWALPEGVEPRPQRKATFGA